MSINYSTVTFLERLGLSQNEIKLYQAALELGETTVTELAKAAKVHRVAAYPLVDSLVKRGLFSQTSAGHGRKIAAKHPRQITHVLKSKQREVRKMELQYEEVLPELTALFENSTNRPRLTFYEGAQLLEEMNTDIIETMKELPAHERQLYSYSNPNNVHTRFEDYVYETGGFVDQRRAHGIRNRVIAADSAISRELMQRSEENILEMVILSEKQFPFKNDITLYSNKMAIQALSNELVGVVIESKEIVQDQLAVFTLAWAGAQSLSHK